MRLFYACCFGWFAGVVAIVNYCPRGAKGVAGDDMAGF